MLCHFYGELGPHVTQCGLGRGLPRVKWHFDPCSCLATVHGPILGCCAPPTLGGAGSPSNTMPPGPRSTSVPSGILIHPAVWPQHGEGELGPHLATCPGPRPTCMQSFNLMHLATVWPTPTLQTGQTDRQTVRQRSYSIERTVFTLRAVLSAVLGNWES